MSGQKVLLVDDDEVNLMTFGMLLEERGYAVTSARTLAEARSLSAQERFQVAVLDVHVGKERSPKRRTIAAGRKSNVRAMRSARSESLSRPVP